jgi:hypothetical protein
LLFFGLAIIFVNAELLFLAEMDGDEMDGDEVDGDEVGGDEVGVPRF